MCEQDTSIKVGMKSRVCVCTDTHSYACMNNQSVKAKQMDTCPLLYKHTVLNEVEIIQYCVCVCVCELLREYGVSVESDLKRHLASQSTKMKQMGIIPSTIKALMEQKYLFL